VFLLLFVGCSNPLAEDNDGDGYTGFEDCNDKDPKLHPGDYDADGFSPCDGDCDDDNPLLNPKDADGDGVSTCYGDCHDSDASLNDLDVDGDGLSSCDGDCDDSDPSIGAIAEDADCDGTVTADDCDDTNPALNDRDVDGDGVSSCDGDCDDANANVYAGTGSSEDCAAGSCKDIRDLGYSTGDGSYWIHPNGIDAFQVDCEMTIDGGGWTPLVWDYLQHITSESREYLYVYGDAWYLSPSSLLVWDWNSYQALSGTYRYASAGDVSTDAFTCSHVEDSFWGIGCSTGPATRHKVNPGNDGSCENNYDATIGTSCICQDLPDIYSVGACAPNVQIYVRP